MRPCTKPSKSFSTSGGKSLAFLRSTGTPSFSGEKRAQLGVRLIGHLLRRVMATGEHLAAHVGGALAPRLDRLVAAVHVAALAPEHEHRHFDLPAQVRAVVLEVDADGGTIVLAHRVDVRGVAAA